LPFERQRLENANKKDRPNEGITDQARLSEAARECAEAPRRRLANGYGEAVALGGFGGETGEAGSGAATVTRGA